jgi:hypothetical protein
VDEVRKAVLHPSSMIIGLQLLLDAQRTDIVKTVQMPDVAFLATLST